MVRMTTVGERAGVASPVARALECAVSADAVDVDVDGRHVSVAILVDPVEHRRRQLAGIGAVTSTGMLHGLWLLPTGGTVPADEIPPLKRARFRSEPGWVSESPRGFERLYNPAGAVIAAAVARRRPRDALLLADALPPILARYVVVRAPSPTLIQDATDSGIGVITVEQDARVLIEPRLCETGRPAVYRWWLGEIAYEQWLQMKAQPVSCAFGSAGPLKPACP